MLALDLSRMQNLLAATDADLATPPTHRHVTTMTCTATLRDIANTSRIHPDDFAGCRSFVASVSKFSQYAVQLKSTRYASANLKYFPKGRVHVTGCRNATEVDTILGDLCGAVNSPGIENLSLNMVNLSVTYPEKIILSSFTEACSRAGSYAERPEKPPSCIVRRENSTALVYTSGKFVVSARTADAAADMYAFVLSILDVSL